MEKDIEKAYLAEQEYLVSDHSVVSLLGMISEFGYNSVEEYHADKALYLLKKANLTIKGDTVENSVKAVFDCFNNKTAGAFMVKDDADLTWIWAGNDNIYLDIEKAKELGYPVYNFNYTGGPIITSNKDFNAAVILTTSINITADYFLEHFVKYFKEKNLNVSINNNDIMLDNKKVSGCVYVGNRDVMMFVIEVSLADHSQDAEILSLKNSIKEVGYISGITRDELEVEVNKWLQLI